MRARLIIFLLRLLSRLPLRMAQGVGAAVGTAMSRLPTPQRKITRRNLASCLPELSTQAREHLMRRSLRELGRTVAELGALWMHEGVDVLRRVRAVHGEAAVQAAFAEGRGLILVTPHLGAWELCGLYCSAHFPLTALYRPPRLTGMDTMMRSARERVGARLVPTDAGGIRSLYQALSRHEAVGILPDQRPKAGTGVVVPFFNQPAETMVLLSRLAAKSGAPVFMIYAERLPRGAGYELHFVPAGAAVNDADVRVSATALNVAIETCVRALPEQYQWSYKRFQQPKRKKAAVSD